MTDIDRRVLSLYPVEKVAPSGCQVELIEVDRPHSKPGESFQDFRKRIQSSKITYNYRCIACGTGVARTVKKVSEAELTAFGYRLERI